MKFIRILIPVLLVASLAYSQQAAFNLNRLDYGSDASPETATTLGLGLAGIASGSSFEMNPAGLVNYEKDLTVEFGFGLNSSSLDRSYPYYDSFGGFTDYGSYIYNQNSTGNISGFIGYKLPFNLPFFADPHLAVGFHPVQDFNFAYEEEIRDPFNQKDKLLGYVHWTQEGTLYSIPVTLAFRTWAGIAVGLQAGYLSGKLTAQRDIVPWKTNDFGAESLGLDRETESAGLITRVGILFPVNERIKVGGTIRLPLEQTLKIKSDVTAPAKQNITYPLKAGLGFEYNFINELAARINADIYYEQWSEFRNNFQAAPLMSDASADSSVYKDIFSVRIGIEHFFLNQVPLRIGFLYSQYPQTGAFARTMLTAGTGFSILGAEINLAAGVQSQEYFQNDLFNEDRFGLTSRTDPDRVQDTDFFVKIDMQYALDFTK